MKQIFYIKNQQADDLPLVLSLSIGKHHAGFAITGKASARLYELGWCSTEKLSQEALQEFTGLYPVLKEKTFSEVLVQYSFAESTLVPSKYFRHEEAGTLHAALFGKEPDRNVVSETIAEWQLHNVYALPAFVQQWLSEHYQQARFYHRHTIALRSLQSHEQGVIQAEFGHNSFSVLVSKGSKLLLAQTYSYASPADVLYHLLKTCQEFSLAQQEVQLLLSGFIDRDSALYKELYQYFIHIEFRYADIIATAENPSHFFTSLNDLAQCAS